MRAYLNCLLFFVSFLLQLSCGGAPFVWVDHLPSEEKVVQEYRVQCGDQVEVVVWDQAQISGVYQVREDGVISIPLVGEVSVAGSTPVEIANSIKNELEQGGIVHDVRVVVISRQVSPKLVTLLGEVESPGQIELKANDTILDVLAKAGGLTEFADKKSIYVFRPKDSHSRIRFNYNSLTTLPGYGINFRLKDGDIIIVE